MENECIDPQVCGPVTPIDPIDLTPAPDVEIRWDWESVCLSNDGGLTKVPGVAVYDMADPQNPVATLYIGSTDVTGTHTIVSCENADVEQVDDCFQDIADPSIKYKRVIFVDTADVNTVYATIWIDINGAIIAPPINVEACSQAVASVLPVCDVLTATVGGTIPYTLTGSNVAITYTPSLTLTNDTVLFYWTDFGTGYSDVGPSPDYTYEADGHYEIKSYIVTASGNKILIAAKEVDVVAGVVTVTGPNPHVPSRTYQVSVGSAMQEYSGTTPVGTPINPDGSAYTVQGTLAWSCPIVIDELEDNAEWNPENVADLVECEVISGGGVVTEGVDANLNAISTLLGTPTPDNRHILLGNTLSISSTGPSGIMATGLNVAAAGLITGAQFTFNIDLIADSDPGDLGDFGIVVWDNVAGTSVLATSITAPFPMSFDPQGSGLNFPLYGNPVAPQSFQVVWTGDLPAGDYTVGYILQDLNAGIGADSVNLSVTHNIVAGGTTTTKAQLVALDQCTIDALTPAPVVEPIEVPNGRIIINSASMSVIVGGDLVRSFSVKGLDNVKYNISFDNGTSWLTDIDGGDSWGEGNSDNLDISQVFVSPSVNGDRVFIHWETI